MKPSAETSATPILEARRITKRFPGVVALSEVSLAIRSGEFHAIVGENGAGKSTLMKILSGVIPNFEGELLVRGAPVRFDGTRAAEKAGIRIIHQELNLVEQLTALANILLGRELKNAFGLLNNREMNRRAAELFKQLECQIRPDQLVRSLRVGDQQLVEIAKALSMSSDILIMDEPTSALTETEVERLFRVLDRLQKNGVTILYISHKMDEVFRLADRITVLRDGQFVATVDKNAVSRTEITRMMVGREIESTRFAAREPGNVALEVKNLALARTDGVPGYRLKDIRLQVRAGEIVGVAGLMRAGRTELLECLFGASPRPPEGEILVQGKSLRLRSPAQAKKAGIALVTEDRKRLGIFSQMNVAANITLCRLAELAPIGVLFPGVEKNAANQVIDRLRVKTAGPGALITSLPGGNQQKAIIGRWLLTEPKILLLDDPTRGVDVGTKADLYQLIDGLCRQGLAIIVTSSELPELLTLCDRIYVMCEGRITGELSREQATEHAIMELATQRPLAEAAAS